MPHADVSLGGGGGVSGFLSGPATRPEFPRTHERAKAGSKTAFFLVFFSREGQVGVEDGKPELLQLHIAEGAVAEVDGGRVQLDRRRVFSHRLQELRFCGGSNGRSSISSTSSPKGASKEAIPCQQKTKYQAEPRTAAEGRGGEGGRGAQRAQGQRLRTCRELRGGEKGVGGSRAGILSR